MQIDQFWLLLVFIIGAVTLFGIALIIEKIISPGVKPQGFGRERIESSERSIAPYRVVGFQYFLYALVFVVFEAVFVVSLFFVQDLRSFDYALSIIFSFGLLYAILFMRYLLQKKGETI
ncbi:MAG: hypothetical protein RAK22_00225 [Nanoarchaeota archaeon]|nr:hypothetical protein [Nanoarchaeota archaeon]